MFEGLCKNSNELSLNDILLLGLRVKVDLFDIIIRFRKLNYVIMAEIEKENYCDYQRMIWRNSPEDPISHFKLYTVTNSVSP